MNAVQKRVALYARVSTDKQSKESPDDQLRVCERLAEREGFTVAKTFIDEGISGGTAQRPAYQQMLDGARAHEFDFIVAEDLKRFWREQAEQWRCIKELIDLGIGIITVSGIDSRQANFEVIAAVIGAAGELDRKEAAYRTRRGLEGLAMKNRPTGGRSYGYTAAAETESKDIEINVEQAAVVREIFEWFAGGKSPRWIAQELNSRGVPSPGASWNRKADGKRRDGKWMASAIHGELIRGTGILNNCKYVGQWMWGREKWRRGAADSHVRTRHAPDVAPITHTNERLRIVSQDLWQRVKARQTQYSRVGESIRNTLRSRAGRRTEHLLSGEIVCPQCGSNFVIVDARHYGCSTHKNGGESACTFDLKVRRDDAEAALKELLSTELLSPEAVALFAKVYNEEMAKLRKAGKKAAASASPTLQAKLAKYDAAIASLREQAKSGLLPGDVVGPAIAAAEAQRKAAVSQADVRTERKTSEIIQLLPATAESFSASLQRAVTEREFLEPGEMVQSKRNLREMLGSRPMTVERGANGRAALRVRMDAGALMRASGSTVDNVVAGGRFVEPLSVELR